MRAHGFQRGFSMIELLVAMAIGGFLIIGAVTMQANTRKTFTVNEQQARLQETARYVISVIEPELQMAGGYGFTNRPEDIRVEGISQTAQQLRMWSPQVSSLPGSGELEKCGRHYAFDVISSVSATNNSYGLTASTCAAQGGGHNGISDTLTIRHASAVDAPAVTKAKFQLMTARLGQFENKLFVSDTRPVTTVTGDISVRDMVVETFYVAKNADNRPLVPAIPALRLKQVGSDGVAPVMQDTEVVRGIEDLQVEFGVDPGTDIDGDGYGDVVNGITTRYVAPDNATAQTGQISAVRLWVLARADDPEAGFKDTRTYTYAGKSYQPNDGYRRVLMSRTVYLRNARGMAY